MAEMKTADIRAMSPDQMDDAVLNLKKERFNLRFQRATGQLESTARVRVCNGGSASRIKLGGRHGFSVWKFPNPTPALEQ